MDRIEDLNENILTVAIYNLIPRLEGHTVTNKLLDGTIHRQVLSEPLKLLNLSVVTNDIGLQRFNNINYNGEPIKIFYDNKFYIGIIDSLDKWDERLFGEVDTRLYITNLMLAVGSEGLI